MVKNIYIIFCYLKISLCPYEVYIIMERQHINKTFQGKKYYKESLCEGGYFILFVS